ncbi:MAG TPA: hypothetical protein VFN35_36600 [Ktedonobacteraceae bacterium]|nr:hypothetical protein [Ktedonobacteraceae bacterium]
MNTQTTLPANSGVAALQLRRTLRLDAFTCLAGAIGFLAIGISPLGELLGFFSPALSLALAGVLLIYAGWLLWLARRPAIQARQIILPVVINDCWVVGWLAVLIFNLLPLTLPGKLFVSATVVGVAIFACVEFYAARKIR